LLMGIMGHAGLLLLDQPEGSPARESLLQIENEARRAAELTNQLLAYAGKGRFQIQRVDLTWLVADTVDLLKISISKKARLLCQLEKGLPGVEAEPTQLRQVVMNLVTNASDALGDQEGAVTVRTGSREMTAPELAGLYTSDPLAPGSYVVLEVIDTGSGMDEETKARIFDPFFTTKFTGRGLGLAAVLGIVRNHRGGIQVISAPHQGTTFRILLPVSTAPTPAVPAEAEPRLLRTGQGRILVVDDEPILRAVLERMLASTGFEVVTAANGHEALDRVRAGRPAFDLVLLDLTMPDLDGFETFREIHRVRPDLKVILTSGYSEPEALEKFGGEKLAGFIEKPFRIEDLLAKIHAVLPATASGPVPSGAQAPGIPAPRLRAGHKPGKPRAHRGRTGGAGHGRA
jgi:CheY-like chemotaxis protein